MQTVTAKAKLRSRIFEIFSSKLIQILQSTWWTGGKKLLQFNSSKCVPFVLRDKYTHGVLLSYQFLTDNAL